MPFSVTAQLIKGKFQIFFYFCVNSAKIAQNGAFYFNE